MGQGSDCNFHLYHSMDETLENMVRIQSTANQERRREEERVAAQCWVGTPRKTWALQLKRAWARTRATMPRPVFPSRARPEGKPEEETYPSDSQTEEDVDDNDFDSSAQEASKDWTSSLPVIGLTCFFLSYVVVCTLVLSEATAWSCHSLWQWICLSCSTQLFRLWASIFAVLILNGLQVH